MFCVENHFWQISEQKNPIIKSPTQKFQAIVEDTVDAEDDLQTLYDNLNDL